MPSRLVQVSGGGLRRDVMAKFRLSGAAGAIACLLVKSPLAIAQDHRLDRGVLDELNFARSQPQAYGRLLAQDAPRTRASGAYDDPAALDEALECLARQSPVPILGPDPALAEAALSHASFQARAGTIGHAGPGGESLGQRLRRYGAFSSLMGENIAYGYADPREVVRQLIVDSGVPDRGHRANIFNPAYREAGVGCGPHPAYRVMCVIDFAGTLTRR